VLRATGHAAYSNAFHNDNAGECGLSNERLITLDQLADRLGGIGRASIYRHIKTQPGFPKPVKVGRLTRFRASEVDRYISGDLNVGEACDAER